MYFNVTDDYKEWLLANKKEGSAYKIINGVVMGRLASACWFTNIDHGKRHEWLKLDTMAHNLKFNKKLRRKLEKEFKGVAYPHYDNYDAIEVPFTECIPSEYDGVMGVPITFMDKYNPEQFRIIDITKAGAGNAATKTKEYPRQIQIDKNGRKSIVTKLNDGADIVLSAPPTGKTYYTVDDTVYIQTYPRILIQIKKRSTEL